MRDLGCGWMGGESGPDLSGVGGSSESVEMMGATGVGSSLMGVGSALMGAASWVGSFLDLVDRFRQST